MTSDAHRTRRSLERVAGVVPDVGAVMRQRNLGLLLARIGFGDDPDPRCVEATRQMLGACSRDTIRDAGRALLASTSPAQLPELDVPTLGARRFRRRAHPARDTRREIAELVPDADWWSSHAPGTCSCTNAPTSSTSSSSSSRSGASTLTRGDLHRGTRGRHHDHRRSRRGGRSLDRCGHRRHRGRRSRGHRSPRARCAAVRPRHVRPRCWSRGAPSSASTPSCSPVGRRSGSPPPTACMRAFAEHGRGFPTRGGPVPIVPAAAIYDLVESGDEPPGPEEGRMALAAAGRPIDDAPSRSGGSARARARRSASGAAASSRCPAGSAAPAHATATS